MSLVFDLLSSINNPNQQGSVSQLEGVVNGILGAGANQGINPTQIQSVVSALGGALGPILKQQASTPGGLEQLIGQIAGGTGGSGANALQSLITPQLQQQILQTVGQKTGISPNLLQGLIPTLLPALLGLFNLGASKPGVPGGGVNPLLSSFLSGGTGQSNDLGNALNFANRFLNPS